MVVSKDKNERIKLRQSEHLGRKGAVAGGAIGLIAGMLFLGPVVGLGVGTLVGGITNRLRDVGVSDDFVGNSAQLKPGSSALALLMRSSDSDACSRSWLARAPWSCTRRSRRMRKRSCRPRWTCNQPVPGKASIEREGMQMLTSPETTRAADGRTRLALVNAKARLGLMIGVAAAVASALVVAVAHAALALPDPLALTGACRWPR